MSNLVKKLHSSVFTKLLFVMIITGVIVVVIIGGFIRYYSTRMITPFKKNAIHYTNYLIREIGTPLDTLKALKIAQNFSIRIRFEGPNFQWTTDDNIISFRDFDRITSDKNEQTRTELDEGIYYVAVNQDSGQYLFAFDFKKGVVSKELLSILLVILLSLVFATAYLLIRRILKPIKWLTEGVEQLSKGNLDYQVQVEKWRRDELGKLAVSFNGMTKQIREMIRSKEQLLLDVSHELRSPLTRIKVALEFIPDGDAKENITEDVLEVEKMISEILETERLKSEHRKLHLEKANVSEIIKEVTQDFQNKPPGVNLTFVPEKVFLKVDIDFMKIVLRNILENAIKFSKPENLPVEISIDEEEKYVVIQIKDYGSGIPEDELPFIFEPFYRIDKSRSKKTGGYGLGMSLCKKIMEAHGGTIEIRSKLNIGTIVFLKFKK